MDPRKEYMNKLILGDSAEILKTLEDNSVDSVVTDPPAGISFMGKDWDHHKGGRDQWILWLSSIFLEINRVLKPGGHCLVWALPRTSHWTAMALEDAGFEVRDCVYHIFGSGFPKNLNVGKVVDKYLKTGNASWNGTGDSSNGALGYSKLQHKQGYRPSDYSNKHQNKQEITEELAKQYEGWGTALKPAVECWWLVRKPLSEPTVAQNVLKWGTGGINIDGCRVGTDIVGARPRTETENCPTEMLGCNGKKDFNGQEATGRFPANLIHDGSDEVVELFPRGCGSGWAVL